MKKTYYVFESVDTSGGGMCVAPINRIDDLVYIGDHNAASNSEILSNYKITHIVNCAKEIPNYFEKDGNIRYLNLNLEDTNDSIIPTAKKAYTFILKAIEGNPSSKILVHCHMGMSRSASIVIYYMMKNKGCGFYEALERLKTARSIVRPNDSYRKQLVEVGGKDRGSFDRVKQKNTRGKRSITIDDPSSSKYDVYPYERRDGIIYYIGD